jgi:hypothetical protein
MPMIHGGQTLNLFSPLALLQGMGNECGGDHQGILEDAGDL